jgi:zinc protease
MRAMQRKLNPYPADNVRYIPTLDEDLERLDAVTVGKIRGLYESQVSANTGEFGIVGDFDADAVVGQLKQLLGGWESQVKYQRIERPAAEGITGERITINTPDKANALYLSGLVFRLGDNDPEFAALDLGNFLLGGGTLSSRLGNRVRQKEGLSYGVNSSFQASPRDPASNFIVFAICNPTNMAKVEKAIDEEVTKFLKEGVSLSELDDGKRAFLEQMKLRWTQDRAIATTLANNLSIGRDFSYYSTLEKKINELTAADIQKAFQKYIVPSKQVIVEAGDFNK